MLPGSPAPFGQSLRRLREAAGLTQERLAERAGVSVNAIAALETGKRQRPYPHTVRALADALGLPDAERAALERAVPGRSGPPEARSTPLAARLPSPPTGLVGREGDLVALDRLLRSGTRIVTLTGPGGVGKSRLAVEVARMLAEAFPDGPAFVGLAPLSDAGLVVPAVARALGLKEAGRQDVREALREYLRGRRLLLVLDNFEHVLDAALDMGEMVASSEGLALLVTSRAPLRVRGEREYPVRPLEVPDLGCLPGVEEVSDVASARLFLERARAVSSGFELTRANAAAIAAICRRLDGLPLALELAAARIRAMGPTELLTRLDSALPMLTGGARDLPERQRTMRATIGWSYQLLGEPQWRLLNRLSVFRGGWDLEAAEAVGAGGEIAEGEVLDLLSSLVEQSLAVAQAEDGGRTRYRLLVPVREYAEEPLEQSGEADDVRCRHADHYLALAEAAEQGLRGSRSVEVLDRLDRERDNLRVAMEYLLARGDAEAAARMAWGLWLFWWIRGYLAEGWRWTEGALECDPELSPLARARLLAVAGAMAIGQDDQQRAEDVYSRSYPLFEAVGDADGMGRANIGVGIVALARGDAERADEYLREAVAIYRRIGDDWYAGLTLSYQGLASLSRGDHGTAETQLDEGLVLMRKTGDRVGTCIVLYNLSLLAQAQKDYDRVATLFGEALRLSREIGDYANIAYCMEGLAAVAVARGESRRAATLLGAAEGLLEVLGAPVYTYRPDRSLHEQTVSSARSQLDEREWEAAWGEGREMTPERAVEYAYGDSGSATLTQGATLSRGGTRPD